MKQREMVDVTKIVKNLRGEEMPLAFPTPQQLEALPREKMKDSTGKEIELKTPDIKFLPKETIRDVVLSCLGNYLVQDKKEGFYINSIADVILNEDKVELKDKFRKFLIHVLEDQSYTVTKTKNAEGKETEERKGLYLPWVIARILLEFGEKPEDME